MPGPQLFIADLLSKHNHSENRDGEISGMSLNITVIEAYTEILECMMDNISECSRIHSSSYLNLLSHGILCN